MALSLQDTFAELDQLLLQQVEQILRIVRHEPGSAQSPFIILPEPSHVDLEPLEMANYVAITSNEFAKATRLAGICRALLKSSEGHYKHKVKVAMGGDGANKEAREALAQKQATEEHNKYIAVSSMVELAESWETATRIASESARRMQLTVEAARNAEHRMNNAAHSISTKTQDTETYQPW